MSVSGLDPARTYRVWIYNGTAIAERGDWVTGSSTFSFTDSWVTGSSAGKLTYRAVLYEDRTGLDEVCDLDSIVINKLSDSCDLLLSLKKQGDECFIQAKASNIKDDGIVVSAKTVQIDMNGVGDNDSVVANVSNGSATATLGPVAVGDHSVYVEADWLGDTGDNFCSQKNINVTYECEGTFSNTGEDGESQPLVQQTIDACEHVADAYKTDCSACTGPGKKGIWTGLGCISTDIKEFMQQIFTVAISLGGGFSFLLLIYGAFMFTTSAGDPKNAENAKGIITGAITGLLVIIFAAVILQIVGVDILQIPGFS